MIVRVLTGLTAVPFLLGAAASPGERQHVAFRFEDPAVNEASALVATRDDLFATTNDSGDTGRVFTVDRRGRTVGVTHWADHPVDVEALTDAGDGAVWVGDIGDNRAVRDSVQVARIPIGRGDRTVRPTVYNLVYPDGAHDAETLLCDRSTGRLYVATKVWAGGLLYAAPKHLVAGGPNRLTPVASVLPIATDGAFFPDGRHLVIRGYLSAVVYDWPSMRKVASLALPQQPQGEGIAVAPSGTVYVSSEGLHSDVLRVPLSARLGELVTPSASMSSSPPSSPPSSPSSPSTAPSRPPVATDAPTAEETTEHRSWWPWVLGGLVGLGALGVLLRSLRPR